jgi:hypothetical protein
VVRDREERCGLENIVISQRMREPQRRLVAKDPARFPVQHEDVSHGELGDRE